MIERFIRQLNELGQYSTLIALAVIGALAILAYIKIRSLWPDQHVKRGEKQPREEPARGAETDDSVESSVAAELAALKKKKNKP